jgi:multiple sugar transport system permease protein
MALAPRLHHKSLRENLQAWLYLAPAAVVLVWFWLAPVLASVFVSFTNWTGSAQVSDVSWTGLENYVRAIKDPEFHQVLFNTINYVLYSVPLTMAAALGIALLLQSQARGRGVFRTIYFLPYVTTWVAISVVFKYIFNEQFGLINYLLDIVGLPGLGWLNEPRGVIELLLGACGISVEGQLHPLLAGPSLAMFAVILTSVWRDAGYFMVIFLAGLHNIDKSYYEAANLDGAGRWQRFRHVTLPLLSPVTFFILIVAMIAAFKVFTPMFIMTPNGSPGGTTETLVSYLYKVGFAGYRELGYASAVAYILFVLILLLTLVQNRVFGRKVQYG